jgi:hypothetical protein
MPGRTAHLLLKRSSKLEYGISINYFRAANSFTYGIWGINSQYCESNTNEKQQAIQMW